MVVASFLRLVTHPKIFVQPTPIADAALLSSPGVMQPSPGAEWPALRKLYADKALAADDAPDAWLAAAAIHRDERVVSFSGDFAQLLTKAQSTVSDLTGIFPPWHPPASATALPDLYYPDKSATAALLIR